MREAPTTIELLKRIEELEKRMKAIEDCSDPALFVKTNRKRCRFVKDSECPGGKFWLPACMGGAVAGEDGCTCHD